jgi:hypothetical protein
VSERSLPYPGESVKCEDRELASTASEGEGVRGAEKEPASVTEGCY